MNDKDKSFFAKLILISVVFVSFLIVLGLTAELVKNKLTVNSQPQATQTVWKIYQNKTLDYEIQYPPDLSIKENPESNLTEFVSNGVTVITIGFISQDMLNAMGISYCGAYPNDKKRCEKIIINGKEYIILKDDNYEAIDIFKPAGGAFAISLKHVTDETKAIFRKMLSSVRFLEKKETADMSSKALATEDWKTYKNEEYGYEIKYPDDAKLMKGFDNDYISLINNNCSFSISALATGPYMEIVESAKNEKCQIFKTKINSLEAAEISCNSKGAANYFNGYYVYRDTGFFRLFPFDSGRFNLKPGESELIDFIDCTDYFNQIFSTFKIIGTETIL